MRSFTRTWLGFAASAFLLLGAAPALAEGLLIRSTDLPAPARASLQKDIDAARAADPQVFSAVRGVRGVRPEVYRTFRNPAPTATAELRALGKPALLALLSELAYDGQPTSTLSPEERSALLAGMVEAVGVIRDARSGPVLKAIFEGNTRDATVLRMTGEALGRLCGDAELQTLQKHVGPLDSLREGAIRGLGHCKRVEAATELSALLAKAPDAAAAEPIAVALGLVGSSWAWQALGPAAEQTGLAVREIAARALVSALPRHRGKAQSAITRSMVMANHPILPALLATARASATPEVAAVIDEVRARIAKR